MKKTLVLLAGLLALFSQRADSAGNNWMSYINPGAYLSDLTIPGTHDSATYGMSGEVGYSWYKTQNENITQQLNRGVRYLDLRCKDDGHWGAHCLAMVHADQWCGMWLDEILSQVYTFLNNNPSETVIVVIKEEGSNSDRIFANKLLYEYIWKSTKWFLENRIPTLGEVRGNIVLLRRFNYTIEDTSRYIPDKLSYGIYAWD